ncbi:MAG: histidine kinase, partial [Longicatena sp.]
MEEIQKGKLKIFFGYCAGVGKTYAMLEAAHMKQKAGIDVVAGYIEPHPRIETITLINGLENIPPRLIHYKDIQLHEFDVDAVLIRKPQLVLIDEL